MAACRLSCTNSKVICATGFLFVAGTWREHEIFDMFTDFHRFWTNMLQLFAPAGAQKQNGLGQVNSCVKYKNCLAPQATPTGNSNM